MKIKICKGIKTRKHHNTKGNHQIKNGKTTAQLQQIAKKLGIPFCVKKNDDCTEN